LLRFLLALELFELAFSFIKGVENIKT